MRRDPERLTRARRVIGFIVAVAATGCTALLGLDEHRSEPSDAATTGVDGATDAASGDAGSADAVADVALVDATDGSDAAAPFCNSDAGWTFCDTFDLGAFPGTWSPPEFSPDGGGAISYSTTGAFSPPRSLMATTPFATPASTGNAYLYRDTTIGSTSSEVRLIFRVRVVDVGGGGQFDLIRLVFAKGAYSFGLGMSPTLGPYVLEKQRNDAGTTTSSQTTLLGGGSLAAGSWRQVDIRLVFTPTPMFSVTLEGVTSTGDKSFQITPTLGNNLKLEVGIPYSEGKWTTGFDDVGLRVVP